MQVVANLQSLLLSIKLKLGLLQKQKIVWELLKVAVFGLALLIKLSEKVHNDFSSDPDRVLDTCLHVFYSLPETFLGLFAVKQPLEVCFHVHFFRGGTLLLWFEFDNHC